MCTPFPFVTREWSGVVVMRRCRKVSEAGSQQLLLDTQAIKALLLDFPSAGQFSVNSLACLQCSTG